MRREVFFSVSCPETRPGLHVRVVGSGSELGSWESSKGFVLQTSARAFPTWSADRALLLGDEPVEYKFVICDGSGEAVRWEEERPNRRLHLALCHRGATRVTAAGSFNCAADDDDESLRVAPPPLLHCAAGEQRLVGACAVGLQPNSMSRRESHSSNQSFGSIPVDDASQNAAFAPTVRERKSNSRSHFDDRGVVPALVPEVEHPPQIQGVDVRRGPSFSTLSDTPASQCAVADASPPSSVAAALQRAPAKRGGRDPSQPEPGVPERSPSQLVREESSSSIIFDDSASSDASDTEAKRKPGLPQFEDSYAFVGNGPLGEGTFGLVWRCVPKRKKGSRREPASRRAEERAAKIVRKARLQPRDARLLLGEDGEVQTHMRMQHEHIVTLLEYFDEALTVTLVLEYCRGGDLFDAIIRKSRIANRGVSEQAAVVATSHVLKAIAYLHGRQVVHRDLKCENVLLALAGVPFERNVFKLCDFGFAAYDRGQGLCDRLGSPDTVAPEVVIGSAYSFPADLWSTGVLLYMMIAAMPPFFAQTDSEVLRRVRNGNYCLQGETWDTVSTDGKVFIRLLMTMDPGRRPTAKAALDNDWIACRPREDAPRLAPGAKGTPGAVQAVRVTKGRQPGAGAGAGQTCLATLAQALLCRPRSS